ncbi:NADH dehydrogenase [Betaproteobacteria bacterium GR16-43]|nr:NADH dehydrogenase [Betaproteobacteria bacterium GR16-43]
MSETKTIVIVGGGFAGTTLARALDGKLPEGYELLLISEESHTTFNPMLPEALGASIFPEQVVAPIREMLDHSRFIMGCVQSIDVAKRTLTTPSLAGERVIAYEHLVLAFGNRAHTDLLPGMAEHALPLKTVGDAMHIRNIVLRRVAQIELERDPEVRGALGHFVVVGGGFSGVETAGELVDCLRNIRRYFRGVRPDELKVTLLQGGPRLLPELPERLGAAATRSLVARGVDVRINTRASRVSDREIELAQGRTLATATVICTIGTRPNPLVQRAGLATDRGRIVVHADLSVPGAPGVWAIGDCALALNAHDGQAAPPTAQYAVQEALCLAANLRAAIAGLPRTGFSHRSRGSMAAIGYRKGVAEVFGIPLSGLPAWLLWRAYYLSRMPTFGRKVRIFVEWTWGMFFPNDITHLRFHRSGELDAAHTKEAWRGAR